MLELLGGDPHFYESPSVDIPASLEAKPTGGFTEVDGCVVPNSFAALLRGELLASRLKGPFRVIVSAQLPDPATIGGESALSDFIGYGAASSG